jgi:hypothetical protein
MTKNMTLAATSEQDMNEWIRALRLHQIDLFRSRSSIFDQWLNKQGVKVPGGPSEAILQSQFIEDAVNDDEMEEVIM